MTRLTVIGEQLAARATLLMVGRPEWRLLSPRDALPLSPIEAPMRSTRKTANRYLAVRIPLDPADPVVLVSELAHGSVSAMARLFELRRSESALDRDGNTKLD